MTTMNLSPLRRVSNLVGAVGGDSREAREIQSTLSELEEMPGAAELLFTQAAETLTPEKSRKVRLYQQGGVVDADGGLNQYAEMVRAGGRGDDDILLHVSPEEFDALKAMWGNPEVNPQTGLPEYGFLSKAWKKIKKGIKKVVKSPIFQFVAPIVLNMVAPGLGGAIGSALGASGTAASTLGNAVIRGGLGAAGGGKRGALAGVLSTPGVGGSAGRAVGLTGRTADIAGSAALGGIGSKVSGGDFQTGALSGALQEYTRPAIESATRQALGKVPGLEPEEINRPDMTGQKLPASQTPTPGTTVGTGTPQTSGGSTLGNLGPLLLAGAMSGGSGYEQAAPPEDPEGFGDPLPLLEFDRGQYQTPGIDYYTYGQAGGAQPGEVDFFSGNVLPSTTPPIQSGGSPLQTVNDPLVQEDAFDDLTPSQVSEILRNQQLLRTSGRRLGGFGALGGFAQGGHSRPEGHYYEGPGSGRDDILDAKLSDGEYVIDAESVALLGDGSNKEGARRLDEMRRNLRKHKGKNLHKGRFSHDAKRPEQYLAKGGKVKKAIEDLWEVYDKETGKVVGKPVRSLRAAIRKVDRLDNEYGGYRYQKRKVEKPPQKARGGKVSSSDDDQIIEIMSQEAGVS